MQTLVVKRLIKAPIEQVFDVLADHANYKAFPGVTQALLLEEGKPDRNGVGAVRRIETRSAWFVEAITAYERPRRFDYRITSSKLPIEHQGGSVRCEATPEGTAVTWTTTLRLKVPLAGDLLTRLLVTPALGKAFGSMLKETERRLAA